MPEARLAREVQAKGSRVWLQRVGVRVLRRLLGSRSHRASYLPLTPLPTVLCPHLQKGCYDTAESSTSGLWIWQTEALCIFLSPVVGRA